MQIEHDRENSRFLINLGDEPAELNYRQKDQVLDFYHVYVPDAHRGKGVAAKIVIAAFDFAAREGFKVIPTCPFISGEFLPRFPKYQALVQNK